MGAQKEDWEYDVLDEARKASEWAKGNVASVRSALNDTEIHIRKFMDVAPGELDVLVGPVRDAMYRMPELEDLAGALYEDVASALAGDDANKLERYHAAMAVLASGVETLKAAFDGIDADVRRAQTALPREAVWKPMIEPFVITTSNAQPPRS